MASAYRPGAAGRMFNERRTSDRSRASRNAVIRLKDGSAAMDCVVRNLSARGAKLSVWNAADLPNEFQLKLYTERDWRNVTVRWRRGNELGVSMSR